MNKELNLISEAYISMLSESLAPSEVVRLNADVKRTGKSHAQLADDHEKYAARMISIGQDGLGFRSQMLAAQHRKLAKLAIDSQH